MERVVVPIMGYYIASYACEMGEMGERYLGYAKICAARPEDYWEAKACAKLTADELLDSPESALDSAELRAKMQIANMAHPC
jgi:hypothetical protein